MLLRAVFSSSHQATAGLHSAWSVLASGLLNPSTSPFALTASFSAAVDSPSDKPNTFRSSAQQPFKNDTATTIADASNQPQQQGNAAATSPQENEQQADTAGRYQGINMAFGTRQVKAALRGKEIKHGIVHISNTYNNTILCLTDPQGIPKVVKSAGSVGFKNARKSQPVAVEKAAETLAQAALQLGYGSVVVKMKGAGPHKKLAAQTLHAAGLRITELQDITPIAYNGCRLPKRRRV